MASSSCDVYVCEWTMSDGTFRTICGATFTNHPLFTSHVIEAHITTARGEFEIECPWNLCQFSPPNHSHLLFHAYHTLLKSKGAEFQLSKGLPLCQMGNDLVNTIPSLPAWKCEWERGGGEGVKCDQTFVNPALFYSHVKEHVRACGVDYTCRWSGCSFIARNQWNLIDHTRTHTQEKIISCHVCGLLFSSTTRLRDHLLRQTTPTNDTPFLCSICKKRFPTERLLREHLRKHVNTCKCPHCPMTCINNAALLQHITYRHSTSRPYQCPLCQKTYKTSNDLSEHLLTHQSKKSACPYPGCVHVSKSLKCLQRHIKKSHLNGGHTHHGLPSSGVYCCHVCGERFSVGVELTGHLKSIHGFSLPPGHSRFRYIDSDDGLKRLQTVRLDKDELHSTPP